MSDFSERLRAAMRARGISVMALAEALGVTHPAVLGWLKAEKGSKPYPKTQVALAHTLGVRRDWLLYGEGPKANPNDPRGKLRQLREASGMSATDFAKLIKYEPGVYLAVEQGTARGSESMFERIEKVLPITKEELMGGSDFPKVLNESPAFGAYGSKPEIDLEPGRSARYVPLLSWSKAGPLDACYTDDAYAHEGVLAFDIKDRKAFATTIVGNSMEPRIVEGDKIIVCPGMPLRPGDTVLTKTTSGDVMCKIYQSQKSGEVIILSSYNNAYPPMTYRKSELAFIYPVAQVMQNLRKD